MSALYVNFFRFEMTKRGDKKPFKLVGALCNLKPTVLRTYAKTKEGRSEKYQQTSSFVEGDGTLVYDVS